MTTATASTPLVVHAVLPSAELVLRYADQLVGSIPADGFARMPMKDLIAIRQRQRA